MSPKSIVGIVVVLATGTLGFTGGLSTPSQASIVGAWEFAPVEGSAQRGLLIFTESHYSMMFTRGTERRVDSPKDGRWMNEAETFVAYWSITANSGDYTLEGETLTTRAYLANDPGYMNNWPENPEPFTLRIDGDTMTWVKPGSIGLGDEVVLHRVE